MNVVDFSAIGRMPDRQDNAAIAIRRLDAGTRIRKDGGKFVLSHVVPEGHRFAVEPIKKGEPLLSWGLPFGLALRDIQPGEYLCNAGILDALKLRSLDFPLPRLANFKDHVAPYEIDARNFRSGVQVALHPRPRTFMGYRRGGSRGVGTRNFIVILGTTSLTAGFARALEARLKEATRNYPGIDGIVAVAHTEGGGSGKPNNLDFLLRTLAGFMVNPNVGAVLAVDYGTEVLTNAMLGAWMRDNDYPLDQVMHCFYSIDGEFAPSLEKGESIVRAWLPVVAGFSRTSEPLSELKIGLQCGGSDAFSGVSGNPLAGWVAKELIRNGGTASLAETDELIGAESYVLANTRNLETARRFLDKITIFKERVGWHGHSADGNPSGGNKFRGLYNIAIKSIGAARKKDPEVRLDYVIDYAERMPEPGFYFMDSPGNDLESIAGQVGSGCNMIFFTTGNGSITNFPFVPTIKFVTTTGRWNLLSKDMDVNAGRYQDGESMEALGMETFDYTVKVASGLRSVGERAGHWQVSIWRDWRQTDGSRLRDLQNRPVPRGEPIKLPKSRTSNLRLTGIPTDHGVVADQIALIVPTSLCSGQVARMIADDLNGRGFASGRNISRIVALVHTEGCGSSSGENEEHYTRTMVGHLIHPFVRKALLLEHGCERTHNDLMRHELERLGIDTARFGYASVQLDGGIEKVIAKVEKWFAEQLPEGPGGALIEAGLEAMSLGLCSLGRVSEPADTALALIVAEITGSGGTVVVPENATLLQSARFLSELGLDSAPVPTVDYGQPVTQRGFHVMATPTDHGVETLTGLGGTGVQLILAHVDGPPLQGHPMIPMVQFTTDSGTGRKYHEDLDCVIDAGQMSPGQKAKDLLQLLCDAVSHRYEPCLCGSGNLDFQVTRGLLGVSL